jgi:hypothetical protein
MNSKPHRQNSGFQLRYFLAGDCHTSDGAYVLMYGQKIDIETKLRHAESQLLRRQGKIMAAQEIIDTPGLKPSEYLMAKADKLEQEADVPTWEMNLKGAHQELQDIVEIMEELKPQCKYADLDILEQSEASQQEEWLLELMNRAENFFLSVGSIPHDHLQTMRSHPEFKEKLVPYIAEIHKKLSIAMGPAGGGMVQALSNVSKPLLLE